MIEVSRQDLQDHFKNGEISISKHLTVGNVRQCKKEVTIKFVKLSLRSVLSS